MEELLTRAGSWLVTFYSYSESRHEEEVEPGYKTSRPTPSDPLSLMRLDLKEPQPPQTAPPVERHEPVGDMSHLNHNAMVNIFVILMISFENPLAFDETKFIIFLPL